MDKRLQADTFNAVLRLKGIKFNITMGLFWISPGDYLNLDRVNRAFLADKSIRVPSSLNYDTYLRCMKETEDTLREPFPKISYDAWLSKNEPVIPKDPKNKHGKRYRLFAPGEGGKYWDEFHNAGIKEGEAITNQKQEIPSYTLAQCAEATGLSVSTMEQWLTAIERKGQAVFYGPPGTGKTFIAEHIARHIVGGSNGFVEFTQFHPAYTYEDFMQGIRPDTDEKGNLVFNLKPGRFFSFCKRSAQRSASPCVLIIDEVNRANLSRVFGELMYLLEYRDRKIFLADGTIFSIPPNVRVIGTMTQLIAQLRS